MVRPIYRTETNITRRPGESNAGLWYDKFCDQWSDKWDGLGDKGKTSWIEGVTKKPVGDPRLINEIVERRLNLIASSRGFALHLKTEGPFVTGLGRNHPVENGFAWHQTLGTPYLPGSSVKGVDRSWAKIWEERTMRRLIGSLARRDSSTARVGAIIFFTAYS